MPEQQVIRRGDEKSDFERHFTDPYCHVCGAKRIPARDGEVFSTSFDSKTGERVVVMVCNNLSCKLGCERNGGHFYPRTIFSFLAGILVWGGRTCTRCGETEVTT